MLLLLVCIFFALALCISFPPPIALLENTTSLGSVIDNHSANLSALNKPRCLAHVYGSNPSAVSCLDALAKIPRRASKDLYGSRREQGITFFLPIRYQSDDGLCVVDLRARVPDRPVRDSARGTDIVNAARYLISRCVVEPRSGKSGGLITGFSTFLHLNYSLPDPSAVSFHISFLSSMNLNPCDSHFERILLNMLIS